MSRTFAIGVMVLYAVVLFALLPDTGLTDDDDFYLPAGQSYAAWLVDAATFSSEAWSSKGIDAAFGPNHEHPPVAKYALGLCGLVFGPWLGPVDGPRVATVLWSILTALLMLVLARSHLGPGRGEVAGGLAVLFLLSLPRFAFHSRVGTLDVPVAAVYLLAGSFALWGERSAKAAFWAGPLFGLAAATKLNGPFLFAPMLVFWGLTRRPRRGDERRSGLSLPPLPVTVLSMALLGPLVFWGLWPWLWSDTLDRVQAYVAFHLNHYPIYLLYFGRIYDAGPFPPWHAPFVLALWTTPVAVVAAGLYGSLEAGVSGLRRILRRDERDDPDRPEGDFALFLLLNAAATIGVVAFLAGSKYGGVKLFLPFFPFFCLLAGYGVVRLAERLPSIESALGPKSPRPRRGRRRGGGRSGGGGRSSGPIRPGWAERLRWPGRRPAGGDGGGNGAPVLRRPIEGAARLAERARPAEGTGALRPQPQGVRPHLPLGPPGREPAGRRPGERSPFERSADRAHPRAALPGLPFRAGEATGRGSALHLRAGRGPPVDGVSWPQGYSMSRSRPLLDGPGPSRSGGVHSPGASWVTVWRSLSMWASHSLRTAGGTFRSSMSSTKI